MSDSTSLGQNLLGTKYKISANDIDAATVALNNLHSNNGDTIHVGSHVHFTPGNHLRTNSFGGVNDAEVVLTTVLNTGPNVLKVQELNPIDEDHHQLYLTGYDYIDFGDANILGTGGNGWPQGGEDPGPPFPVSGNAYKVDKVMDM